MLKKDLSFQQTIAISKAKTLKRKGAINHLLIVSVILFLNEIFSEFLFKFSSVVILKLQKHDFHTICIFLSYRLFYLPVFYLFIAPLFMQDKKRAFVNLLLATLANWTYGILKLSYAHWRPNYLDAFMVDSKHHCDFEYGNPSGHSIGAFSYWLLFARDLSSNFNHKMIRTIISLCVIILAVLICLSRLYFGAHSINQILLGVGIGYTVYLLGEIYEDHLRDWIHNEVLTKEKRRGFFDNPLFWFWVVCNVIGAIVFIYRFQQEKNEPNYFDSIINCLRVKEKPLLKFAVNVYEKASTTAVFIWMLLGMQTRKQNVYVQLQSMREARGLVFIWRLVLNIFPIFIVGSISSHKESNEWFMIVKQVLVVPVLSYCIGRFYGVFNRKVWMYGKFEKTD